MSEPARLTLGRGESRSALLNQLCAGGARVKLSQRLQPGAAVDLDFKTGAGDHHHLHARVVHVLKEDRGYNYHCGLCFVEADAQSIQRLTDYMEEERKRREVGFSMPRV